MAKYNSEITQEICKYLRAGNNIQDSCGLADISKETYYQWKQTKPDFLDAIKKAEIECKARNIALIQKAAEHTWQAAAWWLERKYSNEFALRQIQELTGKDGQQIPIYIFGGGFLPPQPSAITPSNANSFRLSPVQGVGMAQTVKKDNNGAIGVGKTEPD